MKTGVTIGKTYPAPIIDHAAARFRALAVYRGESEVFRATKKETYA
jgi:deoxyribodipyrimidine photolyase